MQNPINSGDERRCNFRTVPFLTPLQFSLIFSHFLCELSPMAVAAFKSSSRRGTQSSAPSNASSSSGRSSTRAPNPTRRSRSVSASARGSSDISTEFLNKRDNPLFDEAQSAKNVLETSTAARSAEPLRRESGRALSRADSGRRTRSASQCPVTRRHLNYSTSEVFDSTDKTFN